MVCALYVPSISINTAPLSLKDTISFRNHFFSVRSSAQNSELLKPVSVELPSVVFIDMITSSLFTMLHSFLCFLLIVLVSGDGTRAKCVSKAPLICSFRPTTGNSGSGFLMFRPYFHHSECFVRINGRFQGLTPGMHGIHIHTFGDVSKDDGSSAGGHFTDPESSEIGHGYSDSAERHWGDFGNLVVDKDGIAFYKRIDKIISLEGIVGRGMIIHESEDLGPEYQPSGSAGARQAACVIGYANTNNRY